MKEKKKYAGLLVAAYGAYRFSAQSIANEDGGTGGQTALKLFQQGYSFSQVQAIHNVYIDLALIAGGALLYLKG